MFWDSIKDKHRQINASLGIFVTALLPIQLLLTHALSAHFLQADLVIVVKCLQSSNPVSASGHDALIVNSETRFCYLHQISVEVLTHALLRASSDFYLLLVFCFFEGAYCIKHVPFLFFPLFFHYSKCLKNLPNPKHMSLSLYVSLRGSAGQGRNLRTSPLTWKSLSDREQPAVDLQGSDQVPMLLTILFSFPPGMHEPVLQCHHMHPEGRCCVCPRTVLWRLQSKRFHAVLGLFHFVLQLFLIYMHSYVPKSQINSVKAFQSFTFYKNFLKLLILGRRLLLVWVCLFV